MYDYMTAKVINISSASVDSCEMTLSPLQVWLIPAYFDHQSYEIKDFLSFQFMNFSNCQVQHVA